MTFLKRMEEKGAVYYEAGQRAKLYYPRIERREAVLQETEEFLERVFDGRGRDCGVLRDTAAGGGILCAGWGERKGR